MKSGAIKKVAQAYEPYLQDSWQRVGNEFFRLEGDWVQILAFNASRFSDQFVPRSCMEFLKMPGVPTGGFLVQELQNPNATQRWVKTSDNPTKIVEQMLWQFKPSLSKPILVSEIKTLLNIAVDYWPHAYALCIMACESGQTAEAEHYFNEFKSSTLNKPFLWVKMRECELRECLERIASQVELAKLLEKVRNEKLAALKLRV